MYIVYTIFFIVFLALFLVNGYLLMVAIVPRRWNFIAMAVAGALAMVCAYMTTVV